MFGKRNSLNGNLLTIGLDIGYGVTKVVTAEQVIAFPSICGHAREIKFRAGELAARYPGDQIVDEDGRWFVGDLALNQLPPGEQLRLRGRTVDEVHIGNVFRTRLAKVAIGKVLSGVRHGEAIHIQVSTGLPVDHMRDAAELKSALIGQHMIQTDCTEVVANISDVVVMPQPYGTLYAQTLTPNGEINPLHTFMRTGVCDIGTYTVDLALDDDGVYVDAESGSVESGVYTAQERIAAALERDCRQKMPFKVVEEVLRTGHFRASGEDIDYTVEVQEALEPLRSATLSLISEKWKSGRTLDVIYLSGGGAELVKDLVVAAYKQTRVVKNPQVANAQGYLNYAYFKARA